MKRERVDVAEVREGRVGGGEGEGGGGFETRKETLVKYETLGGGASSFYRDPAQKQRENQK